MLVLSLDPGKDKGGPKSGSGWCYQSPEKIIRWGDTKNLEQFLMDWDLKESPVDHIVVEGYKILPHLAAQNVGIPLITVENVGKVKFFAGMNKIPITEYMPFDKSKQQMATGVKVDRSTPKEITHRLDAFNHGRWFLIEQKLAPTALEEQMRKDGLL